MKIKIATWNIGGAKTLEPGADQSLMASYNVDAIDSIVDKLKKISPDIIAFQEIQKNESYDQAAMIAARLGYKYVTHTSFSPSHNEDGAELGNAIISTHPITSAQSGTFINPEVTITWEDGRTVVTHDKGYVRCVVDIDGKELSVLTLHLTPFRKFGMEIDDPKAKEILADVSDKMIASKNDSAIILGDFNIDDSTVSEYFTGLDVNGFKEVSTDKATTPKNRRYDHVLYKGLDLIGQEIDNTVLTDHYLLITEFEI